MERDDWTGGVGKSAAGSRERAHGCAFQKRWTRLDGARQSLKRTLQEVELTGWGCGWSVSGRSRNKGITMSDNPVTSESRRIHPQVGIGHVHLKVADLERALGFYRDVLGFELTQRYGKEAAFLSAGGYHHHIGLNTWESAGGRPPLPGSTGLYHLAIVYPTRAELADALRRLVEAGIALTGASDHGVSEALYLNDPDGNGVELYWDRPPEDWPRNREGGIEMYSRPLDVEGLLREAL
jgi:catechol 2,3-dioxygenase